MTRKSSINDDGIYEPFASDDVPWEEWSQGERYGAKYRQLSEFGGATHVGVGIEELSPGRESNLNHYHMLEEEHVLILDGELTLRLGEKRYMMKAGDYVCFPAGQPVGHSLFNHGEFVCRYVIIGERNPNEVCVYPESGRVSVRALGEGFRGSEKMSYWDDIDTRQPDDQQGKS